MKKFNVIDLFVDVEGFQKVLKKLDLIFVLELICGKMPQLLISIIFPMRLC